MLTKVFPKFNQGKQKGNRLRLKRGLFSLGMPKSVSLFPLFPAKNRTLNISGFSAQFVRFVSEKSTPAKK